MLCHCFTCHVLHASSTPCYNAKVHTKTLFLTFLLLPCAGYSPLDQRNEAPPQYRPIAYDLPQVQDGDLPEGDLRLLPREMELKNLPPLSESDKIRWVLRTTPFSPLN